VLTLPSEIYRLPPDGCRPYLRAVLWRPEKRPSKCGARLGFGVGVDTRGRAFIATWNQRGFKVVLVPVCRCPGSFKRSYSPR
jgi:hypothetical protein